MCLTCTSQSPNPLCKQLNSMEINRKMNFDNPRRLKQPCSLWLMFVLYIFRTNTFPTSSTGNRIRQVVQSLNWFLMMTLFQQRERNEASCFGEALISFSGSLSTRFDFAKKILFEQAKTSSLWNDEKIVSQYIFCVSNYQSCQLCPSDYNKIPCTKKRYTDIFIVMNQKLLYASCFQPKFFARSKVVIREPVK